MARRNGAGHVRIEDVAKLAGVAPITVSRAIRTPNKVSRTTLERINQAVRETGYVPNLIAGGLASNRTNVVAAIVPNIQNSLFGVTLRGLSDALRANGFQLMVGSSAHSKDEEESLLRALLGQRPAGLVLHETIHTEEAKALVARAGIPVVEIGDLAAAPIDMAVGFSNRAAVKALTLHLGRKGYRRIAYVGSKLSARSVQRRNGYREALRELGYPVEDHLMTEAVSDYSNGGEAVVRLLERDSAIDAVLLTANAAAIGAILECHRRGWPVPQRVAIAALDDNDLARQMQPALTCVRIPRYEIGKRAGEIILARLTGKAPPQRQIDVGFEIIERESA